MRNSLFVVFAIAFGTLIPCQTRADILVDRSPDTMGVPTIVDSWTSVYGVQYIGEQFTWAGGVVTGGSIFSHRLFGAVGDSVEFVILPDNAPGAGAGQLPVFQIHAPLDVVDTQYTSIDVNMTRKHMTISPTFLAAGDYWFYMAGNGVNIAQGSGNWGNGTADQGLDGNPDLEAGSVNNGDLFFQLEGPSAIPEPGSLVLLGIAGIGIGIGRGRRRKS